MSEQQRWGRGGSMTSQLFKMSLCAMAGGAITSLAILHPVGSAERSLDPLIVAPDHFKLVFENQYVRVIREHTGVGETVPMHKHALPGVMVLLSDQNIRQTLPDGTVRDLHRKAGDSYWTEPTTHSG